MNKIKLTFYPLLALPALVIYFLLDNDAKHKLHKDIDRWCNIQFGYRKQGYFINLYRLLVCFREFRNIYYLRAGHWAKIIKYFLPGQITCGINSTKSKFVGGGVFIQHGWGMVLDAESVGENLWINQNVTVGYIGNGHPTIGNNVRIGSGAVVLGKITIGDNVNIGANAIVVKDVPSNTTVVSPQAYICKRDGKRVHEEL